jgi:hypothetical protein
MAKDWDESGKTSYDTGYGPKPGVQSGIDEVMRAIIRNPNIPSGTSQFPDWHEQPRKQATRGFIDAVPKAPPPGQDAIGALCDHYLGPAVPKKAEKP